MRDSTLALSKLKAISIPLLLLQVNPAEVSRTHCEAPRCLGFAASTQKNNPGLPVMRWPIRVDDKGLNKCLVTRLSVGCL